MLGEWDIVLRKDVTYTFIFDNVHPTFTFKGGRTLLKNSVVQITDREDLFPSTQGYIKPIGNTVSFYWDNSNIASRKNQPFWYSLPSTM